MRGIVVAETGNSHCSLALMYQPMPRRSLWRPVTSAARLGEHIGLLFQIGDDILDVERSTEELGKTAGKDAASRKLTYPGLYGLEESKAKLAAIAAEALDLARGLSGGTGLFPSLVSYLVSRDH